MDLTVEYGVRAFPSTANAAKVDEVDPMVSTGVTVTQTAEGERITSVVASTGGVDSVTQEISYTDTKVIGNGSFGVVFQVRSTFSLPHLVLFCSFLFHAHARKIDRC